MKKNGHTYTIVAAIAISFAIMLPVYAAEISNVNITDVTGSSATIRWSTDTPTDGVIHYGLDPSYGVVRDPSFDNKTHLLTIANLDPSTTYHFQVLSTDTQGNRSATAGFVFTTTGSPSKKINKEISQITDPAELEKIAQQVKDVAVDLVKPPAIVGSPKVVPETTQATITWGTDKESTSQVSFAKESDYRSGSSNPYTLDQGNSRDSVTKHSVTIVGLEPSTTYHFQASSEDALGLKGQTEDDTFTTKSILPRLSNIKISRIQETSATISWSTGNVLARGNVDFTDLRTKKTKSAGDPVYTTSHSVLLAGLTFGTRYSVIIRATNKGGDEEASNPITFATVRDVVSPAISKVNNESTLFPSEDVKIQTIISWLTDEPAYCQVFYTQGLVHGDDNDGDSLPKETNPLEQHTQVIVGFTPGSVYKFWVKCHDEAKNNSQSEDFVLITPIKEKNIVDLILENFQGSFGWVNNIGK